MGLSIVGISLASCASTQDVATDQLLAGSTDVVIIRSGHQTSGRGRDGRGWIDVPGSSLLLSIAIRGPIDVAGAEQWTTIWATAVARALGARHGLPAVEVKPPNDLVVDGRKLGGMLIDARSVSGRIEHLVGGVGINLDAHPDDLGAWVATNIAACGGVVDIDALCSDVVAALCETVGARTPARISWLDGSAST